LIESTYGDVRHKIATGDVFTFSGYWLVSKAIQWWTHQAASHSGIAVWLKIGNETRDRLCILEAMEPGGIRILPASVLLPQYWSNNGRVFWQKNNVDGMKTTEWALEQWGRPYASWLQFLTIMSPTFQAFRRKIGLPLKVGTGRYHCSELVTNSLIAGGFKYDSDPSFATPGDVQKFTCLSELTEVMWEG
jgi:hypothetical protein